MRTKSSMVALRISVIAMAVLLTVLGLSNLNDGNAAGGFKFIKGEGSICAAGTGVIQFVGSGELSARVDAGQLVLSDPEAIVSIIGKGIKHEFANGWVMYQGFNGKVRLSGQNLFGQIIGKGLRMRAEGEGVMLLTGKGAYKIPCDDPNASWQPFGEEGAGIDLNDYTADMSAEEAE